MAEDNKNPKEASNIFHSILKASVKPPKQVSEQERNRLSLNQKKQSVTMKKILFALGLLLFCVSLKAQTPNPKIWTKNYESEVSSAIYNVADSLFKMPLQKKEYVEYCLAALKRQLPNGIYSVSEDKLKSIYFEIGKNYSLQSKYLELKEWTPEYEEIIKKDLYYSPMLTSLNNKTRLYYCDCYVKGLKELYPKGISKRVPNDIQNQIATKCVELIKANASSLTN